MQKLVLSVIVLVCVMSVPAYSVQYELIDLGVSGDGAGLISSEENDESADFDFRFKARGAGDAGQAGSKVRWQDQGESIDIGINGIGAETILSALDKADGSGTAINVGQIAEPEVRWNRTYPYDAEVMRILGTLGGECTVAYGLNNVGQIVGVSQTPDNEWHAFIYRNGEMTSLKTLGGSASGAYAISESGLIAGYSIASDGSYHEVLWKPVSEPPCASEGPCEADLDGDGISNEDEGLVGADADSIDSNDDGIPDYLDFTTAHFPSDNGSGYMILRISHGELKGCTVMDEANSLPADEKLAETRFPWGFIQFSVVGLLAYDTVRVTLVMPEEITEDVQYWKYDSAGYYPVENVIVEGSEIQFSLTDHDGDGIVTDPGAVGVTVMSTEASAPARRASGGGCSLGRVDLGLDPGIWLVFLIPFGIRFMRMRTRNAARG